MFRSSLRPAMSSDNGTKLKKIHPPVNFIPCTWFITRLNLTLSFSYLPLKLLKRARLDINCDYVGPRNARIRDKPSIAMGMNLPTLVTGDSELDE